MAGGDQRAGLGGRVGEGRVEPGAHRRELRVGVEVAQQRQQGLARVDEQRPLGAGVDHRDRIAVALVERRRALQLGGRLALVADPGAEAAERRDGVEEPPGARRRRRVEPRGDELADAVPAALVDLAGQPAPASPGARSPAPRPARRTPSARAPAPRRRRRAAAPAAGIPPARTRPGRRRGAPRPTPSRRARSRCRRRSRRPPARARRARPGRRRGGRGDAGRRRARRPRAPARRRSRGSRDAGRGRRPRARLRTGARSARPPRGTSSASPSSSGRRCGGRPRRARPWRGRRCS